MPIFIRSAFLNLLRNRRRSLTILLAVAIGIGALFLYHGFNFGIMNQYKTNTIRSRYGHGQINTKEYRDIVYEKPWEHWIADSAPIITALKQNPSVEHIFPRVTFFALLTNGQINVSGLGQGIDAAEEAKFFTTINIVEGKMLEGEPDGVLIGKGLAHGLNIKVGDTLTVLANTIYGSLNGLDLRVVGVFHTGVKEFDDQVFRLPLVQAQKLLDTTAVESIALGLSDNFSDEGWSHVEREVNDHFPLLEATPFAELDKVYYQNSINFLQKQFETIRIIILTIVLLSIFNTVSTSILERKQEIGNLRANGESVGNVITLLSLEGLFLGLFGGLLGILGAYLLNILFLREGILMPAAPGITRQFNIFIELQFIYGVKSFILGTVTALIATLLASLKIVRQPITGLLSSR